MSLSCDANQLNVSFLLQDGLFIYDIEFRSRYPNHFNTVTQYLIKYGTNAHNKIAKNRREM